MKVKKIHSKKIAISYIVILVLSSNFLFSQHFKLQYKANNLIIDSIVMVNDHGIRIGKFNELNKDNIKLNNLVTVFYLQKGKFCLKLDYTTIFCDTIKIEMKRLKKTCNPLKSPLGYYQTCQGSSHTVGFYNEFPCCKSLKK